DDATTIKQEREALSLSPLLDEKKALNAAITEHNRRKQALIGPDRQVAAVPAEPKTGMYEGTLHIAGDDRFEMYVNGKPLVASKHTKAITHKAAFNERDVITVKVFNQQGTPGGFACVMLFPKEKKYLLTGSPLWKAYLPKPKDLWYNLRNTRRTQKTSRAPDAWRRGSAVAGMLEKFAPAKVEKIWGVKGGNPTYLTTEIRMRHFEKYDPQNSFIAAPE
ncbi:MAG: hypothetical protein AAF492_12975, partial [Verrucomicrobiota bacterium]